MMKDDRNPTGPFHSVFLQHGYILEMLGHVTGTDGGGETVYTDVTGFVKHNGTIVRTFNNANVTIKTPDAVIFLTAESDEDIPT